MRVLKQNQFLPRQSPQLNYSAVGYVYRPNRLPLKIVLGNLLRSPKSDQKGNFQVLDLGTRIASRSFATVLVKLLSKSGLS
jgi:hypothetical protein